MKKRNHATEAPSVGEEIIAGLEEALAYERGELEDANVTRVAVNRDAMARRRSRLSN